MAEYRISKHPLSGKSLVVYPCPQCGVELKSELRKAGLNDQCPECQASFTVPAEDEGRVERKRLTDEQAARQSLVRARRSERNERKAQIARMAAHSERTAAPASDSSKSIDSPDVPKASRASELRATGWVFIVLSAVGFIVTINYKTTVGDTHNFGLLLNRLLIALASGGVCIAGLLLLAVGYLVDEVHRAASRLTEGRDDAQNK